MKCLPISNKCTITSLTIIFFSACFKKKKKEREKKTKVTIGSFIIELIGGIKEKIEATSIN